MDMSSVFYPLLGGGLIGMAVTLLLFLNGRVAGISGILSLSLSRPSSDGFWRWFFLAGLIAGGAVIHVFNPGLFTNLSSRSTGLIVIAGLLVGYGTVMGGGCTSGHGVCGLSRLSIRSLVATITFMIFGFLSVQAVKFFVGGF